MNMKSFFSTVIKRLFMEKAIEPGLSAIAKFLHCPALKVIIKPYILFHHIDIYEFWGQKFHGFRDFFARKRDWVNCNEGAYSLISPCDGMLSIFPIREEKGIPKFLVKGSLYQVCDLVTDIAAAKKFTEGYCLIYRMGASDCHQFYYIDDCYHGEGHMVTGMLHSIQPIACAQKSVYRMNRWMWSLMETRHLGLMAQIEIEALFASGIVHEKMNCWAKRGEKMGHFKLAGSTVIQMFTKDTEEALKLLPIFQKMLQTGGEIRIKQGQVIGVM